MSPFAAVRRALLWMIPAFTAALFLSAFSFEMNLGAQSRPADEPGKYLGPGSCASTACHGSVQPRSETSILQNEYSTWVVKDKHSKAFEMLRNPVSKRMAEILEIGPAEKSPKCLACHALDVPEAQRAKTFDLSEGVSCESCHGPASGWLGPHTTKNWSHLESVRLGMVDTKDLAARSHRCLSCHLGNVEKAVDHEMIAAGHPALFFELDSFSAVMPPHWKIPYDKDPWVGARSWGVGQAMQLRDALRQLERRARGGEGVVWPEFAEMQCYACHHALSKPQESWRIARGYAGRRPGNPPWDESRYAVFRRLAEMVDADASAQLNSDLTQLAREMSRLQGDRGAIASTAARAAATTQRFAERMNTLPMNQALVARLVQRIAGDADMLAYAGEQVAEQTAMALDSLWVAGGRPGAPAGSAQDKQVREAIQALFQQLEQPSAYNPAAFAAQLRKIQSLIR